MPLFDKFGTSRTGGTVAASYLLSVFIWHIICDGMAEVHCNIFVIFFIWNILMPLSLSYITIANLYLIKIMEPRSSEMWIFWKIT